MALSKFIEMAISDFVNIEIAISDGMAQLDTGNWSVSSVQCPVGRRQSRAINEYESLIANILVAHHWR